MSRALRNKDGIVIGACDSLPLEFDRNGRRPWRPRARPAADRIEVDITIDSAGPQMADFIKGYTRLP